MTIFLHFLPFISLLVAFTTVWYASKHLERQIWNNGYCPRCGPFEKWEVFGTDSGGASGIVCRRCNNYAGWISHHSVMKERKK